MFERLVPTVRDSFVASWAAAARSPPGMLSWRALRSGLCRVVKTRTAPAKMWEADSSLERHRSRRTPPSSPTTSREPQKLHGHRRASVIELVQQCDVMPGLDGLPSDAETNAAMSMRRLRNTAPGPSGVPAPLWKATAATNEGYALVKDICPSYGFTTSCLIA